jgi:hypothetical protein
MAVEALDKRKAGQPDAFPVWRDKIKIIIPNTQSSSSTLIHVNGRITKIIFVLPTLDAGSIPILRLKNEDGITLYKSGTLTANSENLIEQDIDICGKTTVHLDAGVAQTTERISHLYLIGV